VVCPSRSEKFAIERTFQCLATSSREGKARVRAPRRTDISESVVCRDNAGVDNARSRSCFMAAGPPRFADRYSLEQAGVARYCETSIRIGTCQVRAHVATSSMMSSMCITREDRATRARHNGGFRNRLATWRPTRPVPASPKGNGEDKRGQSSRRGYYPTRGALGGALVALISQRARARIDSTGGYCRQSRSVIARRGAL